MVVEVGLLPGPNYVEKMEHKWNHGFQQRIQARPQETSSPSLPQGRPLEVPSWEGEGGGGQP